MIFNSHMEEVLVTIGFDSMSLEEKNRLILEIGEQRGMMFSDITPEFILDHHKKLKLSILSEECEKAIEAGFTATNGNKYRTNRDDQLNMVGQKDELNMDATITEVLWKTENQGYVSHTRGDWLAVYAEAFSYKKSQLLKYNTLKQQVLDATTDTAVLAVNWQ